MNRYWISFFIIFSGTGVHGQDLTPTGSSQQAKSAHTEPMVVRYYDRGILDARHAYKFELIREAMDITRPEYGDYLIQPYRLEPSSKRQPLLMKEGNQLNLIWASPGTDHAQGDIIAIPIDILHGLLGYRVCLVNTPTKNLDHIKRFDDLQSLRIGQGAHWADLDIYKHNGITPVQAASFEGLFEMLSFNRFDCMALGVTEIQETYEENTAAYPSLAIEPRLLIHYDYPLYFYVSKKFPKLAERINLGLTRLIKNGRFDHLFNQHFSADLLQLALGQRQLICLKSPYQQVQKACTKPQSAYFTHRPKNK